MAFFVSRMVFLNEIRKKKKKKNAFYISHSFSLFFFCCILLFYSNLCSMLLLSCSIYCVDLLEYDVCSIVLFSFHLLTLSSWHVYILLSSIIIDKRCHIVYARLSRNAGQHLLKYIKNVIHMLLLIILYVKVLLLLLLFSFLYNLKSNIDYRQ